MNTPIADFVKSYKESSTARLHMPGHKGVSFLGCEQFDITEINGADELYSPEGIILESENNAAELFGTAKTVYSAGGSSQSINAMLFSAYTKRKSIVRRPFVLAGRNAHKSFIYAAAKLDFDVEWLYSSDSLCRCIVTADKVEKKLGALEEKPFAVYVTSPDYLGGISDIAGISRVCKKHGIPLLVDNAHGAYSAFLEKSAHPIHLGADMCCDSAHKTLPVLTGGGYLHISSNDSFKFSEIAVRAMEMFGSTSPSYLILQSLDICNRYLSENFRDDLKRCIDKTAEVKKAMKDIGINDISEEPLKITADFSHFEPIEGGFAEFFRSRGIECEYADDDFLVFMTSPQNSVTDYIKLTEAFKSLPLLKYCQKKQFTVHRAERKMSIREAIFSPCEEIAVGNALGRICGAPTVSCPPAIPIAVSGEIIDKKHIEMFKRYGINKIIAVK